MSIQFSLLFPSEVPYLISTHWLVVTSWYIINLSLKYTIDMHGLVLESYMSVMLYFDLLI